MQRATKKNRICRLVISVIVPIGAVIAIGNYASGSENNLLRQWRLQSEIFRALAGATSVSQGAIGGVTVVPAPTLGPSPTSTTASGSPTPTTPGSPTTVPTTSPTPATPSFLEGVYVGPADPSGVNAFAADTNTDVTIASDYLPSDSGWSGMDGEGGSLNWLTDAWNNSGYTLSLGVPMIPTDSSNVPQGNLASGAAGSYNEYFTTLAQTLVAAGEGNAYLRLGWEFDGSWYAWQAQSASSEAEYATYFQQIVTAMRSVSGAAFQFVWNPDASAFLTSGYSVTAAYPGNAYVNVIGLDLYDMSWVTPLTPLNAWNQAYLPALSAAESFAEAQNKPLALCEWGALIQSDSHGLGDDPFYVNSMISWMADPVHNVVYESYFDGDSLPGGGGADFELNGGNFPNSWAAFITDLS